MPSTGTMAYRVVPKGLPGFEDYHSIQITYNFQNGIQVRRKRESIAHCTLLLGLFGNTV